jgi:iron complex transport system ATP-binding protein
MLKLQQLGFVYKRGKTRHSVFSDLNHTFTHGINVILGPNGAGKTTLLQSIFGLLPYKGTIFYREENITAMQQEEIIRLMSYLPQMDIETSMLSVLEMVLLGRLPGLGYKVKDEDLSVVMETLRTLNIVSLAERNFSELSGGQKKMVFIAQTLVREPRLILLDEPVNSLDLQKQLELCRLLQDIATSRGVDIVMVLHDINLAARYGHHLVVLDSHGNLHSSGSPQEVVTEAMLRQVYGVKALISHDAEGIPMVVPVSSART